MIQFDSFMQAEGVPIYQQIIRYVKQGIAAGTIRDGEELPSRRVLSALLAVNPNTVQKAYQDLERDQVIYSVSGKGSFIASHDRSRRKIQLQFLDRLKLAARDVMNSGTPLEEAVETVRTVYEEGVTQ